MAGIVYCQKNKNGEASWPESKPYGFDPLNLIQIILAKENSDCKSRESLCVFDMQGKKKAGISGKKYRLYFCP